MPGRIGRSLSSELLLSFQNVITWQINPTLLDFRENDVNVSWGALLANYFAVFAKFWKIFVVDVFRVLVLRWWNALICKLVFESLCKISNLERRWFPHLDSKRWKCGLDSSSIHNLLFCGIWSDCLRIKDDIYLSTLRSIYLPVQFYGYCFAGWSCFL